MKFIDTFIFQFLNPKGVMAAITLISNFVIENDYLKSSLTVIAVCSLTASLMAARSATAGIPV